MNNCPHENFSAKVDVNRITRGDDGPVYAFAADVAIKCADCGQPFVFLCPDGGVLPDRPAVSVDAQEIRLPLAPADAPEDFMMDMGFTVKVRW
jgi:hypothetical protein